jgi:hypothetical protein
MERNVRREMTLSATKIPIPPTASAQLTATGVKRWDLMK